jgi:hypothetical protein
MTSTLPPSTRRRLTCLAIMLLLVPLGFICRFVPIGLPYLIVKYGGSFLWASTVYWFIGYFLARQKPFLLAILSLVVTAIIEFLKRVQSSTLENIRNTFFGIMILGRRFSYIDIAVYWIAILCMLWLDHSAIHVRSASKE